MSILDSIIEDPSDQRRFLLFTVLIIILSFVFLSSRTPQHPPHSANISEPPKAPFSIPILNHTFSFGAGPSQFLKKLRQQTRHPQPYTVTVGTSQNFYVFNGPNDPLQVLWRNAANLEWFAFTLKFTRWMFGGTAASYKWLERDINSPTSFMTTWMRLFHMLPDKDKMLKTLNEAAAKGYGEQINLLADKLGDDRVSMDFYRMQRNALCRVTMRSIWGPRNAMDEGGDPQKFADNYFVFEDGVIKFLYSLFPSITNRPAINGREYIVNCFRGFLGDMDRINEATEFIKQRKQHAIKWDWPLEDHSRSELGLLFAAMANTQPVTFWCAYHTFYDTKLRQELYEELVEMNAVEYTDTEVLVDMNIVTSQCRLLRAVWDEVLRFYQDVFFARVVGTDTTVTPSFSSEYGGQRSYVLKKGGIVQIPMGVVLSDPLTWGDDADKFDPYRFLEQVNDDRSTKRHKRENSRDAAKRREAAFKPFGGGSTHCPGRFFAWTEVSGWVAGLLVMFDIGMPGKEEFEISEGDGSGVRNVKGAVWADLKVKEEVKGKKLVLRF